MKLNYDGQEEIHASYDEVWRFINDPEKVGPCLPDVQKLEVHNPQNFDAHVRVSVGPVRGTFKFKVGLHPRPDEQKMLVTLRGGGLGTAVDLEADANLVTQANTTLLDWRGEAVVRGPAATVGARILDRKASELITHVFAEMSRRLNQTSSQFQPPTQTPA